MFGTLGDKSCKVETSKQNLTALGTHTHTLTLPHKTEEEDVAEAVCVRPEDVGLTAAAPLTFKMVKMDKSSSLATVFLCFVVVVILFWRGRNY